MHVNLPICVLVLGIVISIVTRVYNSTRTIQLRSPSKSTIFVGMISFCDINWYETVDVLFRTAASPERLRIGIVEYVKRADDSMQHYLPSIDRHRVRVMTVSHTLAKSQQAARTTCFDTCYRDEDIVLFQRSANMPHGWDDELERLCSCDSRVVVSTALSKVSTPLFPALSVCEKQLIIKQRPLQLHGVNPVVSLIWQSDWSASNAKAASIWLSHMSELDITAELHAKGYQTRVPGHPFCVRVQHPRGIKKKSFRPQVHGLEFGKSIGIDLTGNKSTPAARLGLSETEEAYDSIAKYGSVIGARIAYQNAS